MDVLGLNLLFHVVFSTVLLSFLMFCTYQYLYFYGNAMMNLLKYHVFKKYSNEEIQYFLKHNKIKKNNKIEKFTKILKKSKLKFTKKEFIHAYKMQNVCFIKNNQYMRINFDSGSILKLNLNDHVEINELYLYFYKYYQDYFFNVIKENKKDRVKKVNQICDINDYIYFKQQLGINNNKEEKILLDKKRSLSILLLNDMLKFSAILLKEDYKPQKYWSSSSIDIMSDIVLDNRHKVKKPLIIKEEVI